MGKNIAIGGSITLTTHASTLYAPALSASAAPCGRPSESSAELSGGSSESSSLLSHAEG